MISFSHAPGNPHPRQLGTFGVVRSWKSWSFAQPLGHAVSSLGAKGGRIRRHLCFHGACQLLLPAVTYAALPVCQAWIDPGALTLEALGKGW